MDKAITKEIRKAFEVIWDIPDDTFEIAFDTVEKGLKDIAQNPNILNQLRNDFLGNKMSVPQIEEIQSSLRELGQEYLSKIDASSLKARYLTSLIDTYIKLFDKILKEGLALIIPVDIELMQKDLKSPSYVHLSDAGCDICACVDTEIPANSTAVIKTGIKLEIPDGFEVQVRPRSGMSVKTPIMVIFGTVDSGYRGEIGVIAYNRSNQPYTVSKGERVAQLVLAPSYRMFFKEVPEIHESSSERGANGFGSSGS